MRTSKFDWNQESDEAAEQIFYGRMVKDPWPAAPGRAPAARRAKADDNEGLRPADREPADFGEGRDAPPVIAINSYAGSLVQAVKDCGLRVAGSFEDAAYGLDVQRLNFPELDGLWAGHRRAWPEGVSFEERIVITHPPCAAFSKQQTGNVKKQRAEGREEITGTSAAKFQCTVDVIGYALPKKPMALAIESVPDAFTKGAREVHEAAAAEHGYRLFHVHQNAATFGVPQWRPRYWAVYMRPDCVRDRMAFVVRPQFVPFSEIMDGGEPFPDQAKNTERQWAKIREAGILDRDPVEAFSGDFDDDGRIWPVLERMGVSAEVARAVALNKFDAQNIMFLARQSLATTLVHNSWWWCGGRLASKGDFNVAMGFPRDYRFPDGKNPTEVRALLSRGVCPPVASWLLETIVAHIQRREPPLKGVTWCELGGAADLLPDVATRKALLQKAEASR
jgi:site-specific DNA-cytosine methylase